MHNISDGFTNTIQNFATTVDKATTQVTKGTESLLGKIFSRGKLPSGPEPPKPTPLPEAKGQIETGQVKSHLPAFLQTIANKINNLFDKIINKNDSNLINNRYNDNEIRQERPTQVRPNGDITLNHRANHGEIDEKTSRDRLGDTPGNYLISKNNNGEHVLHFIQATGPDGLNKQHQQIPLQFDPNKNQFVVQVPKNEKLPFPNSLIGKGYNTVEDFLKDAKLNLNPVMAPRGNQPTTPHLNNGTPNLAAEHLQHVVQAAAPSKANTVVDSFQMSGTTLSLVQGDLTKEHVEVIVNAANRNLQEGGGVCAGIFNACRGGQGAPKSPNPIATEIQGMDKSDPKKFNNGNLRTGQAVITGSGEMAKKGHNACDPYPWARRERERGT